MIIPKYVNNLLERAEYSFHKDAVIGYTINIDKHSIYATPESLTKEVQQLVKWIESNGGKIEINYLPEIRRYKRQQARVTIYDPIMKEIEHLISKNNK